VVWRVAASWDTPGEYFKFFNAPANFWSPILVDMKPTGESRHSEVRIDMSGLERLIGYTLRRAQIAVFADFVRFFAQHDVRPTQYGVLFTIGRNPGATQASIAEALGIKRSNFVKLIDEFERRDWVVRQTAVDDKRANALHLTKTGETALTALMTTQAALEARIDSIIGSPDDKRWILAQLARLARLGSDT
jgi:DNA-binding MarR family transcriptional regulator